ncbi:MAG: GyrI-like domain-containing protein [Methanotrichaceae archaeon]
MLQDIKVVEVKEQPVLSIRETTSMQSIPQKMGEIFSEIFTLMQKNKIAPVGPPFAYWHDMTGDKIDMECGFPVSGSAKGEGRIKSSKLPGGKVATALHIGPYDKLAEAYKAVESWIRDNGYHIAGNSWEAYLSMPDEAPSKIRTQIYWRVK